MSRQSSAWMPLYVGDYLGDTQRLTTEQHGAYLLLILDYWRNGPAPDDDSILQQITKLDRAGWKKHRPALSRLFQIEEGEWRHKRIDRELENAASNAERRTRKAKTAAQARWGNATSNAPSMPQALLEECPPQSPSPKKSSVDKSTGADAPPADPEKKFWADAKAYLAPHTKSDPGSLIGRWHKGRTRADVKAAITAAQIEKAMDPVAYVEGVLRRAENGKAQEAWVSPC